jgi:hypothetical protein
VINADIAYLIISHQRKTTIQFDLQMHEIVRRGGILRKGIQLLLIILIEVNAKCRHLKKLTCERDFAAGVLSVYHSILIHTGSEGEFNQREG